MDNSDKLAFVKHFYREHLKRYGNEDIRGMGWHNEIEYSLRFELYTKLVDLNNSSILDVGCGYGGLYKFLISSDLRNFSYLGIDILPEMVDAARRNNPTGKFMVADLLNDNFEQFDYVFCIGAMNIKTDDNFEEYFLKIIMKMIKTAKKAVIINFLSDKSYLVSGPYHFADAKKLRKRILEETNKKIQIVEFEELKGESCLIIKV